MASANTARRWRLFALGMAGSFTSLVLMMAVLGVMVLAIQNLPFLPAVAIAVCGTRTMVALLRSFGRAFHLAARG